MLPPLLPINGKALVAYDSSLSNSRSLADTIHPKLCKFTIENQVNGRICDFPYDIDVVVFPISSFSKPKLPPKAMSSCCQKYTLKPDDLSCFPKVGTTQAALLLVFSALGSNVLLSGEPIQLHYLLLLGRQR